MSDLYVLFTDSLHRTHRVPVSSAKERQERKEQEMLNSIYEYCGDNPDFADKLQNMLLSLAAEKEIFGANLSLRAIEERQGR